MISKNKPLLAPQLKSALGGIETPVHRNYFVLLRSLKSALGGIETYIYKYHNRFQSWLKSALGGIETILIIHLLLIALIVKISPWRD